MTKKRLYVVLVIQLITLFFLPAMGKAPMASVSGKAELIYKIIMYTIYAGLSIIFVLQFVITKRFRFDKYMGWLIIFLGICLLSMIWGLIQGEPLTDVVRGVLPFVWYIYVGIIVQEIGTEIDSLIPVLALIALAYTVRLLLYYGIYHVINPLARVSYYFAKTSSFMVVLGVCIFSYMFIVEIWKKWATFIGLVLCYIAVVITESKATLLVTIVGVIFEVFFMFIICIREKKNTYALKNLFVKKGLLVLGAIGIVTVFFFSQSYFSRRWKIALNYINDVSSTNDINNSSNVTDTVSNNPSQISDSAEGSIGVRIIEYQIAFENWKKSPVLGQGIGYRWTADGIDNNAPKNVDYGGPRLYMHNIIAYVLMDLGLVGFSYLVLSILWTIITAFKILYMPKTWREKMVFFFFLSTFYAAFIYANFTAIFRDIEFTLLCVILISGMMCKYKEYKLLQ